MSVDEVLARVDELAGRTASDVEPGPSEDRRSASPTRSGQAEGGPYKGKRNAVPLVELTGGEPLLQEGIYTLAERLVAAGYTVMIETSGERFIGRLPREVIKIVDVKCPDSGEPDTFEMRNLEELTREDEVKFVIASRRDYEFAREFTKGHRLADRVKQVLFSPVFDDPEGKWKGLEARTLVEWMLEDALPVRLGLQLHKFVWDPATKGV
jgi:7-carboxy-7-deazaguanine synthase